MKLYSQSVCLCVCVRLYLFWFAAKRTLLLQFLIQLEAWANKAFTAMCEKSHEYCSYILEHTWPCNMMIEETGCYNWASHSLDTIISFNPQSCGSPFHPPKCCYHINGGESTDMRRMWLFGKPVVWMNPHVNGCVWGRNRSTSRIASHCRRTRFRRSKQPQQHSGKNPIVNFGSCFGQTDKRACGAREKSDRRRIIFERRGISELRLVTGDSVVYRDVNR